MWPPSGATGSLEPSADDVGPDAPLPPPARGRDPSVAVVDLLDLFAGGHDPHRLRLARLAAEEPRPAGRAPDVGARDSRAPGAAASLDLRRPRLLRHWASDFGRNPRLGHRIDIVDQRRRGRASDAQLRPRAAMARSQLAARRHTHGRALSGLRTRLLRRPLAQAPRSGAVGVAQGAPLRRSADAAGELPRPPA